VHGHAIRAATAAGQNPNADGHEPWNKGNDSRPRLVCDGCGKKFRGWPDERNESRYCTLECYEIRGRHRGEDHHFWTGGVRTKYKIVRQTDGTQIRKHRIIMARLLGRKLLRTEVVHHKDGNGLNNKLSNLHLFHCDQCHRHHHRTKEAVAYIYVEVHREEYKERRRAYKHAMRRKADEQRSSHGRHDGDRRGDTTAG
jgi:hypothetical protein